MEIMISKFDSTIVYGDNDITTQEAARRKKKMNRASIHN
jgi:hypothetical protein